MKLALSSGTPHNPVSSIPIVLGVAYACITIVESETVCSRRPGTTCPGCRRYGNLLSRCVGFTSDFSDETYAVVWRDNSAIHFVRAEESPKGVHLFQWVKDIDAYYNEIAGQGIEGATEPTDQPYGIREFGLRDINGVGIVFGQDIEHASLDQSEQDT